MSRRRFLQQTSALGAASLLGLSNESRADPPPEVTRVRLVHAPSICLAPQYLAEDFLRLEGFKEVEYVLDFTAWPARLVDEGRADFTQDAVPTLLPAVESGSPLVALAGVHVGCYELFARDHVRGIRELKGRSIAIPHYGGPNHMLTAIMLAYIGIDPIDGVDWIIGPTGVDAMQLYIDGKADAYLTFAPQGHTLRERKAGHVIVNTAIDRPWSQYFCCMVVGHRQFVAKYPIATKRVLRAFLRATEFCEKEPQRAAQMLKGRGFEQRYEVAIDVLRELSFSRWRETHPEDTIRFHALRLHEAKIIRTNPERLIARGTDWRFLNELKKEMKA